MWSFQQGRHISNMVSQGSHKQHLSNFPLYFIRSPQILWSETEIAIIYPKLYHLLSFLSKK